MLDSILLLVFSLFINGSYPGTHNRIPTTQQNSVLPWYPSAPSHSCAKLNLDRSVSFVFIRYELVAVVEYEGIYP